MLKITFKSELGDRKSQEEFDKEIARLENLPPGNNEYTAVVHLGDRMFFVIYESDQPFNPEIGVAGTREELMGAVAVAENWKLYSVGTLSQTKE